jgi:hypothetical protein
VSGLRVVTSTTLFADIVGQVGGSRVSVVSIVPLGVGPEDYEPRTGDDVTEATFPFSAGRWFTPTSPWLAMCSGPLAAAPSSSPKVHGRRPDQASVMPRPQGVFLGTVSRPTRS